MAHQFIAGDDVGKIAVHNYYNASTYRQSEMEARAGLAAVGGRKTPSALRVAPLLAVLGETSERRVIIGSSRVVVSDSLRAVVEVSIVSVWTETSRGVFALRRARDAKDALEVGKVGKASRKENERRRVLEQEIIRDREDDKALLIGYYNSMALSPLGTEPATSNQHRAAAIAKSLCEASRDSLAHLRQIRYALEHRLADTSSASDASTDHTEVVSSLIQLNVMCGRASDEAREAIREGLWLHITDSKAYHAYRRLRDPDILVYEKSAKISLRPWFRLHDAAMRQCEEMRKQLDGESESINTLIVAGASISSSKDADAQSRFNVLAAMASVGLGLPALVLTLYGASILLPMNSARKLLAFAPVALSLAMACLIALWQGHRQKRGAIWNIGAVVIILVLLALLLAAGYLAPPSTIPV